MKTEYAIQKAGSKSALARILGVTKGAISQYGLNLPEGRTWQLRCIRPEWFNNSKRSAKLR